MAIKSKIQTHIFDQKVTKSVHLNMKQIFVEF